MLNHNAATDIYCGNSVDFFQCIARLIARVANEKQDVPIKKTITEVHEIKITICFYSSMMTVFNPLKEETGK